MRHRHGLLSFLGLGAIGAIGAIGAVVAAGGCLDAADTKHVDAPGAQMDFGDLMHYFVSIPEPSKQVVNKAIAVRLDQAGICYDMETMRVAATWSGSFIDMGTTNVVRLVQGVGAAPIAGTLVAATMPGPGWADGHGSFADPRSPGADKLPFGKLPDAWLHYLGVYRHGHDQVLSYTVGTCAVRECPGVLHAGAVTIVVRSIEMDPCATPTKVLIAEVAGAAGGVGPRGGAIWSMPSGSADACQAVLDRSAAGADHLTLAQISTPPAGAMLEVANGRMILALPSHSGAIRFAIAVCAPMVGDVAAASAAIGGVPAAPELATLCRGSTAQWPSVTTSGTRGADSWAYAVDSIALPTQNPWKSWMRPTGVDFFADGRVAICTLAGDVWIASGVDGALASVVWKRFAAGLFEPMGLRIVKDIVYVLARDQIVRLEDLNGDGEADFYQSFNNDATVYPKYNDFAFDLQTDKAGNFYYARGGHGSPVGTPLHSCVVRVSADGRKSDIYAQGLRAPNGMGMGPEDQLSISDNQGNWVPSSRISLVHEGGWYGFPGNPAFYKKEEPPIPAVQDPPLCWIPMSLDNSSGGEVWAPASWGPLGGHMLHTSYGLSSLMEVVYEVVGGVAQGGVVPLPLHFSSGIMRGRFSPMDGQLYVCGLKGWQTNAGEDGCLQRVRATHVATCLATSIAVTAGTLTVGFSSPLDRSTVSADNVSIQAYGYHWTSAYGSDDYLASDPKRKGRDHLEVAAVHLSPDGHSVAISIPGLKPVMQMEVTGKFRAADGGPATLVLANTISVVPGTH